MINKMYREPPFDDRRRFGELHAGLRAAADALNANHPGSHAFLADDLLAWFRNLDFLGDEEFNAACQSHLDDPLIRARIWRVYTLCWSARSCLGVQGDYVDLGCYDGKTVEIIARYIDFSHSGRQYYLYDLFDDPPLESRKAAHGPQLFVQVEQRVSDLGAFHVVRGHLPDALAGTMPERIAFAQVDLNSAETEVGCLELFWDRVSPGGIVVLDDYGFARYRRSQELEKRFFAARGISVLELPTGQGLVLKR